MKCKICGRIIPPKDDDTLVICNICDYEQERSLSSTEWMDLPGIRDKTPNQLEGFDVD